MRRRQRQRPSRAKLLEQRNRERCALFRRGTRAHFVHQNQRPLRRDFQHGLQIQHVRRKCGKVGGDGLLVADINQHAVEHRHLGALRRHRNSRLRGKRRESHRFQRNRFAACVRPADNHHRLVAAQREAHGHGLATLWPQRGFEHRISRRIEPQRIARGEFRDDAIELPREPRTRKNRIEMRDGRCRRFEWPPVRAHAPG